MIKDLKEITILICVLAGWFCLPGQAHAFLGLNFCKRAVPLVKVQLADEPAIVQLSNEKGFYIKTASGQKQKIKIGHLVLSVEDSVVAMSDTLGKRLFDDQQEIWVEPIKDRSITYGNRRYRGRLHFVRHQANLKVINELDMENYLKGVVPREMGILTQSSFQALKAQAVAARTYALYKLREQPDEYLAADVLDQVYGGESAEYDLANRAVDQTRGAVLFHNKVPIKAYYSSTCGGKTAAVTEVWDVPGDSCLLNLADTLCRISRHYSWEETWSRKELEKIIAANLPSLVKDTVDSQYVLRNIAVVNRLPSGRVDTLAIRLDSTDYRIARNSIRWVLRRPVEGHPILRSTLFNVAVTQDTTGAIDTVRITGHGNGHGVGMCQWGAIARAQAGWDYGAILSYFYPRTRIKRAY